MKLLLERIDDDGTQTLGNMYVLDEKNHIVFSCFTLELPWKMNERNVSCIPDGVYTVKKRFSQTFGEHFIVEDVEDRSYILIHIGNFHWDIRGCILVGDDLEEISGDNHLDVVNSGDTMNDLLEILPEKFEMEII